MDAIGAIVSQAIKCQPIVTITPVNRNRYRCLTRDGQELTIERISESLETLTLRVTIMLEEYLDEGTGVSSGGNTETLILTVKKKPPHQVTIQY